MKDGKLNRNELKHYNKMTEMLPKTADGVLIYPGLLLFYWDKQKQGVSTVLVETVFRNCYQPYKKDSFEYKDEVIPTYVPEDIFPYAKINGNLYPEKERNYWSTRRKAELEGVAIAEVTLTLLKKSKAA